MLRKYTLTGGLAAAAIVTVTLAGCNNASAPAPGPSAEQPATPAGPKSVAKNPDEDHGHKPGAHGGIIVALGRDSYHAEAVFEKGGTVRLYTLGKDEARIQEVDAQELTAFVTPAGSTEAEPVKFVPQPQPGDGPGKTSLFVATLPPALRGKVVQVTISNLAVGGERFRVGFTNESVAHADAAMPGKRTTDEERAIFLTPGGMYTDADIRANGGTTPGQKYQGVRAAHDANPKPGDKVCPISETKANPKFTWVVGGKTYEFCCTPCVQEFVSKAKEAPDQIKDPDAYRAK
jgi:hypothetical protein